MNRRDAVNSAEFSARRPRVAIAWRDEVRIDPESRQGKPTKFGAAGFPAINIKRPRSGHLNPCFAAPVRAPAPRPGMAASHARFMNTSGKWYEKAGFHDRMSLTKKHQDER